MRSLQHLVLLPLLAAPLAAQLAGNYTINPDWPAAGTNYTSFAAAVADLAALGVASPVFFDVFDDAGPYNEGSPFTTANGSHAPNTAVLAMGSWAGTSSTNLVTFRAAPGEAPILDATGRAMGVFWGGADYVTIEGFEIRSASYDAVSLYAESTHGVAYDPIIRRCRIHDCGGTGVTIYGNTAFPVNTLVESNFFWRLQLTNNGSFNTTGRFGYVTTRRSTNTRIVHNTFLMDTGVGSSCCAIGAYPSGATEIPYAEISNNVVLKTAAAGTPILRIQSPAGGPLPTVSNSNCFYDLTASPFALYGTNAATIAATLIDWQTNTGRDLQSLWADPALRDLATPDLHLQLTSPCFTASTVDFGSTTDIDGQPRAISRDMGADEISGALLASVGAGCPGTGALSPVLWSNSWPFLGNPSFGLLGRNLPPFAPMFTFVSFGTTTTPYVVGAGCNVYLQLAYLTALPVLAGAGTGGTASVVINWPNNAAYVGVNFGFQAMVIDAGAPLGLTLTNALDVVLGF